MSFVLTRSEPFSYILRILGTNLEGKRKLWAALTKITGVGKRFATLVCLKAKFDPNMRAGELEEVHLDRLAEIIQNPQNYGIPKWFMNRRKDLITGVTTHLVGNNIASTMREDLERMRKMQLHRGLRHMLGLRVRGQHTKTTGRRGRTVGVSKKKGG